MVVTILTSLLPVIVTLLLGYFAAWRHDFGVAESATLNKLFLSYALPLSLFAGIITTPLSTIVRNMSVVLFIGVGMVGGYTLVVLLARWVFHADWGTAALRAMAIAGPAVPAVGISFLGDVYPKEAEIAIGAGAIALTLVLTPATLLLLGIARAQRAAEATAGSSDAATAAAASSGAASQAVTTDTAPKVGALVLSTVKKSIVWAPFIAFGLVLFGVELSKEWTGSFTLLGQATGGIALFAVGTVLWSQSISISWSIVINVVAKTMIVPGIALIVLLMIGFTNPDLGLTVVTLALPPATVCVIFAVEYETAEKEMASSMFGSVAVSMVMIAVFMWISGSVG